MGNFCESNKIEDSESASPNAEKSGILNFLNEKNKYSSDLRKEFEIIDIEQKGVIEIAELSGHIFRRYKSQLGHRKIGDIDDAIVRKIISNTFFMSKSFNADIFNAYWIKLNTDILLILNIFS